MDIFSKRTYMPGHRFTPIIPALWDVRDQDGRIAWAQEFKTSLGNINETPSSQKNLNISQVWWHIPVVPATWEAEPGGLLEPRKSRLQWAWTSHYTPASVTEQDPISKKRKKGKKKQNTIDRKATLEMAKGKKENFKKKNPQKEWRTQIKNRGENKMEMSKIN